MLAIIEWLVGGASAAHGYTQQPTESLDIF